MTHPLISIVVATYNGERFLEAQLDSIISQTYPTKEVIIIDDGSTDRTPAIINRYAQQYSFVSVVVNETNLGYVRNFEKGMLMAKGELIALSDQDDIWHPDKLSVLFEQLGDSDIVFADSRLINDANQPIGHNFSDERQLQTFDSCLSFLIGNTVSGHNMLIRRSLLEECVPFPTVIPHDHWLCFVATFRGPVRFVPQVLVDYRQHADNIFGVTRTLNGEKRVRKKKTAAQKRVEIRERARLLAERCPAELPHEKRVLTRLYQAYQSFSLPNNFVRMTTFFRYRKLLLATKKRTPLRKWLFCLKMFATIK